MKHKTKPKPRYSYDQAKQEWSKQKIIIKYEPLLWVIFVLVPIFTGWLHYDYLPHEYPYDSRHEVLEFYPEAVGPEGLQSAEVPDKWRDIATGEIFTSEDFADHRKQEAWRRVFIWFAYGLVGCFLFATLQVVKKRRLFFPSLGIAVAVNFASTLLFYGVT